MATLLPLPPAIAYGLPWRIVFPTKRAPVLLERLAYPDFVASLTPGELEYCEIVLAARLTKMLAARKLPNSLGRAHVNLSTSEILFAQLSPPGLKVSLGSLRYTLHQALVWVDTSLSRLVKALRPDPGTRQPEYQNQFTETDWVTIGYEDAPPAAPRGPKPGSPPVRRPAKLLLTPPANKMERRKRQDDALRLRSKSGHTIKGDDYRLGWLLFEAHKVVSLNRPEIFDADHVIGKLSRSIIPGATDLAKILETQLNALENMDITQEIRWILRELHANTSSPKPWTLESLLWAFGVSEDGKFDPHFWSAAAPPNTFHLRRKLGTITAPFRASAFYSPALAEMADHLTSLPFMGSRHLRTRLGPVVGDSNVIGVARFMTDVAQVKLGRMDNVPVALDGRTCDLFYWNQDIQLSSVLDVCDLARDLTAARGAFRLEEIVAAFGKRFETSRQEMLIREILNEWSAVHWLDLPGYGVVIGASQIVGIVEQMLHAAWPHAVPIDKVVEALDMLRAVPRDILSARARLRGQEAGLVEKEVLLEALAASGKMRRVGHASLALMHKPKSDYWAAWRPVERDLIDFLRSVGGTASNKAIFQHFKTDKSAEPEALADAMKTYPYLYAPAPRWTALWPWAMQGTEQ
ncbi:hypothetical protein [Variovorax sp. RA8]|uniref:hypothetical protein n=1 Tax=Variovorax sp. (strain JCM 16519 / RA8) TaxID=662548 RepID=UPI00131750D1|nr:hypothetical protein [Variovorax sp. RA8]VTU44276.1 hypothetical protein RA8P2_00113 [Variovorax sp. RA8]